MIHITRRSLLQAPVAALAAQPASFQAKLKPLRALDIRASPLSIGFETLDRKQFDAERTFPHLAELGVKWARCQTGWARTETKPGEFDFAWLDQVVDGLLKIGVEPWFNLGYGNRLYTPGAPHESAVGWAPVFTEEARKGWVRFVERIARHYRTRVKVWEIWNEPNIPAFWQPEKPSAESYMDMVRLTAPVLRKEAPGCVLIGGGFASIPQFLDYLEDCLDLGLADLVEKISYHPYRAQPEWNYANDVRSIRGLVDRYRPGMPLWQGENGAPSFGGGEGALSNFEWNEQSQAKWLLRRLVTDLGLGIEVTSYFLIVDIVNYIRREGQTGKTNPKGVLRGNEYTRKPSYFALQNLCTLFDAETQPADFLIRLERGQQPFEDQAVSTHTFARKGRPLYTIWIPAVLQRPFTPQPGRITLWSGQQAPLEMPVLVNLMTGDIAKPDKAERRGGFWHLEAPAVPDYPLVITDASAVA
jgi:hypothetical protein